MNKGNQNMWFQDRLQKARKENYWVIVDTQRQGGEADE